MPYSAAGRKSLDQRYIGSTLEFDSSNLFIQDSVYEDVHARLLDFVGF